MFGHFDQLELTASFNDDGSICISNRPSDHTDRTPYPIDVDVCGSDDRVTACGLDAVFTYSDRSLRETDAGAHVYRMTLSVDKGFTTSETVRASGKTADRAEHGVKWVQAAVKTGVWLVAATHRASTCVADVLAELAPAFQDSRSEIEGKQFGEELGDLKAPLHEIFQGLPLPEKGIIGNTRCGIFLFTPAGLDGARWCSADEWTSPRALERLQRELSKLVGKKRTRS